MKMTRLSEKKWKSFPTDHSAKEAIYLAIQDAAKKWTMPIGNWRTVLNLFMVVFDDRLNDYQ
jgi:putative transposase